MYIINLLHIPLSSDTIFSYYIGPNCKAIQMKSVMLLAAHLMLHHFFTAVRSDEIYISPNSTKCSNYGMKCMELKDCIKNASQCIQSNTTFIFMPGIHRIDVETLFLFQNVDTVQLIGSDGFILRTIAEKVKKYGFDPYSLDGYITYLESSTKIVCDQSQSAFLFVNITNLKIANLTIVNCGLHSSMTNVPASVHMVNVSNLLMAQVSIQNSTGYGLWGMNVLGHSQLIQSSFIGNNQFVKGLLHKNVVSEFPQNDGEISQNTITVYENDKAFLCKSSAGGSVVLTYEYLKLPHPNTEHELFISSCLFSLAVDFTYASLAQGITCNNGVGTGLSVIMNHRGSYYLNVKISNTTSYRNQANYGANLHFSIDINFCNISLENVSSLYGTGFSSGLHVANSVIAKPRTSNAFRIIGSTFKYNFSPISKTHPPIYLLNLVSGLLSAICISIMNCSFIQSEVGIQGNAVVSVTSSFKQSNLLIFDRSAQVIDIGFNNCIFIMSTLDNNGPLEKQLNIQYNYCTFERSSITVSSSNITINSCTFTYSRLNVIDSSVSLNGIVQFANNVYNHNGGAIALYSSNATFGKSSNITSINNTAVNGGSIYMDESSFFIFPLHTFQANFINNTAKLAGGAIYARALSSSYISQSYGKCFFHIPIEWNFHENVSLYFEGNTAEEAGSVLYGGNIENCPPRLFYYFKIGHQTKPSSLISSEAMYICHCIPRTGFDASESLNLTQGINIYMLQTFPYPTCQLSSLINSSIYPGQKLFMPFITYGQAYGSAPAFVFVYSNNSETAFISTIRSHPTCETYEIKLNLKNGTQYLATETALENGLSYIHNIGISITVLPCPTGFVLDNSTSICVCTSLLRQYKTICKIENLTLQTIGNNWIGLLSNNILGLLDPCPFDYCKATGTINVTNFDSQCAFSRQGVLCGQCQDRLSMTFGTSQCKDCSNYYLLLIIPFALMGVALVALLFLLNLAIANGSLNGLIFYANIIKINDKIFFPKQYSNTYSIVFSTFIAWLNFDFGIETCFYNGMDSYAKTWLQFAFPIYIYCLVAIIIVAGKYSTVISKLCRFNAVPVLAIIIQLSYSKILHTIITIFSSASLYTEHAAISQVWLYDGNIAFLSSRHLPLFILGVVITALLIIPYTILLLFVPCLQSRSHWKFLKWVNILKPFLDFHAAPYKDHFQFWAGVLLLGRFPLHLISALVYSFNTKLLGIFIIVYLYLLLLCWFSVYKKWYHTILEIFFHLNLLTLTIAHLFEPSTITSHPMNIILTLGVGSSFFGLIIMIIIYFGIKIEIGAILLRHINTWRGQNAQSTAPNDCNEERLFVER